MNYTMDFSFCVHRCTNKKINEENILTEKVGFEGNGGVKRKGTSVGDAINSISPMFINVIPFYKSAKYRTIVCILSPIPCSLSFYTTIAFKTYIPLTFSQRMFFISCIILNSQQVETTTTSKINVNN